MNRSKSQYRSRVFEAANARPTFVADEPVNRIRRRHLLQSAAAFAGAVFGGLVLAGRMSIGETASNQSHTKLSQLGFTTGSTDTETHTKGVTFALEAVEYDDPLSDAPDGDVTAFEQKAETSDETGVSIPLERPAARASQPPDIVYVPYPHLRMTQQPPSGSPSPIPGAFALSENAENTAYALTNSQVRPSTTPSRALAQYLNNETRRLHINNINTGERNTIAYASRGHYDSMALDELDHLFRDYRSGQTAKIDAHLYDQMWVMQKLLGVDEMGLISGYRTAQTNNLLRSQSSGVARNSYHVRRQAVDIRLSGVSLVAARDLAVDLGNGGVGYYRRSNFLHMDTGPVRYWSGS